MGFDERSSDDSPTHSPAPPLPLAAELGRKAGRLLKAVRPRIRRVVVQMKPQAENAARDAVQYARDHAEEIRDAAAKLARSRVRGPLRPMVDAFAQHTVKRDGARGPGLCRACETLNPVGSRFCNQCGSGLEPPEQPG